MKKREEETKQKDESVREKWDWQPEWLSSKIFELICRPLKWMQCALMSIWAAAHTVWCVCVLCRCRFFCYCWCLACAMWFLLALAAFARFEMLVLSVCLCFRLRICPVLSSSSSSRTRRKWETEPKRSLFSFSCGKLVPCCFFIQFDSIQFAIESRSNAKFSSKLTPQSYHPMCKNGIYQIIWQIIAHKWIHVSYKTEKQKKTRELKEDPCRAQKKTMTKHHLCLDSQFQEEEEEKNSRLISIETYCVHL